MRTPLGRAAGHRRRTARLLQLLRPAREEESPRERQRRKFTSLARLYGYKAGGLENTRIRSNTRSARRSIVRRTASWCA